jgi:hypothetical protein
LRKLILTQPEALPLFPQSCSNGHNNPLTKCPFGHTINNIHQY